MDERRRRRRKTSAKSGTGQHSTKQIAQSVLSANNKAIKQVAEAASQMRQHATMMTIHTDMFVVLFCAVAFVSVLQVYFHHRHEYSYLHHGHRWMDTEIYRAMERWYDGLWSAQNWHLPKHERSGHAPMLAHRRLEELVYGPRHPSDEGASKTSPSETPQTRSARAGDARDPEAAGPKNSDRPSPARPYGESAYARGDGASRRDSQWRPGAQSSDDRNHPSTHFESEYFESSEPRRRQLIADYERSFFGPHNKERFFERVKNHSHTALVSTAFSLNLVSGLLCLLFRKLYLGGDSQRKLALLRPLAWIAAGSALLCLVALAIRLYLAFWYFGWLATANVVLCALMFLCDVGLLLDVYWIDEYRHLLCELTKECLTLHNIFAPHVRGDKDPSERNRVVNLCVFERLLRSGFCAASNQSKSYSL